MKLEIRPNNSEIIFLASRIAILVSLKHNQSRKASFPIVYTGPVQYNAVFKTIHFSIFENIPFPEGLLFCI